MVIQHNISALNSWRNTRINNNGVSKNLEKLASGLKINRSADDAAGLGISEKMRGQIREMAMCQNNASQGIDAARTADGGLNELNALALRARELCVQASNGTYAEEDRVNLEKELNAILDEIDRIAEYTNYNQIPLLRWPWSETHIYKGKEFIGEEITPVEGHIIWDQFTGVAADLVQYPEQVFDMAAPPAEAATVTMRLDDSINLNNASTIVGKDIYVAGSRYTFYAYDPSDFSTHNYNEIAIHPGDTLEDALNRMAGRTNCLAEVSVNAATREVTFTGTLNDGVSRYTAVVDGQTVTLEYVMSNSIGTVNNGITISSHECAPLGQVDGQDEVNNPYDCGAVGVMNINIAIKNSYAQTDIDNLLRNSIRIQNNVIAFSTDGAPGTVQVWNGMTGAEMKQALEDLFIDFGWVIDWGTPDNNIYSATITRCDLAGISGYVGMYEANQATIPAVPPNDAYDRIVPVLDHADTLNPPAAGISSNLVRDSSAESGREWEIKISSADVGSAFTVNGRTYLIIDDAYLTAGYDQTSVSANTINITGATSNEEKYRRIFNAIESAFSIGNGSSAYTASISGDTMNVKFQRAFGDERIVIGAPGTVNVSYYNNTTVHVPASPGSPEIPGSSKVLFPNTGYFVRDFSFPMQMPLLPTGNVDINALVGRGFSLGGYSFEFSVNGSDLNEMARNIDISQCVTLQDLADTLKSVLEPHMIDSNPGADFDIVIENTASGILRFEFTGWMHAPNFTDGFTNYHDGLLTSAHESVITYSDTLKGGIDSGHPGTTIDFSSVTTENIDELRGYGFRIYCATCPDEFINVFFRTDNSEKPIPSSFINDDGSRVLNCVVELKYISDPSQIASEIVRQLSGELLHFSNLRVDPDDPNILIVEDTRRGDIYDNQGNLYQGKVVPGLDTNFTYNLYWKDVYETIDDSTVLYKDLPIYVGSFPYHQYIPLHIPNLTMNALGLERPPAVSLQTVEDANVWLEKIDAAAIEISKVRGILGADYNRLESAFTQLGNAKIQISASESTIRDVDMAKEMIAFTKNNILVQAAQSMLAQANQLPQGVLSLLR